MSARTVRDVMTETVVTVRPDTGYKEIVDALIEAGVSAVPVVDEQGHVLGIVSEADLLHKVEFVGGNAQSRVYERLRHRAARAKAGGDTAVELMSRPVITIGADASVTEAARLMEEARIKRLPVVDDDSGVLRGIVARRDLLRDYLRPDAAIREEIVSSVLERVLLMDSGVEVTVLDGVARLRGMTDRRSTAQIAARLVRAVPGVVDVIDQLDYGYDDTELTHRRYTFDAEP